MKAFQIPLVFSCLLMIAPLPVSAATEGADPYYDEDGNPLQNPPPLEYGDEQSGSERPASDVLPDPGYMPDEEAPPPEEIEPLEPDAETMGGGE